MNNFIQTVQQMRQVQRLSAFYKRHGNYSGASIQDSHRIELEKRVDRMLTKMSETQPEHDWEDHEADVHQPSVFNPLQHEQTK